MNEQTPKPAGTTSAADDLAFRKKRLLFRSTHRGMKELDVMLGGFAQAHLADLDAADTQRFEVLLDEQENDLFDWLTGKVAIPPAFDHALMGRIRSFKRDKFQP
jgi:antitoxin CptB